MNFRIKNMLLLESKVKTLLQMMFLEFKIRPTFFLKKKVQYNSRFYRMKQILAFYLLNKNIKVKFMTKFFIKK